MIDDLVKELRFWNGGHLSKEKMTKAADRIEQLECEITSNATHLDAAMVSIEQLKAALYEIAHINNMRDRFSSEIDNVITTVLGEKK